MTLPNAKNVLLQGRQQSDSLGELLSQLASQSAALVRDEVALAKREFQEKVSTTRFTMALIGLGAVIGVFALQMALGAVFIALAQYWGWLQAAVFLAIVLGMISTGTILFGIHSLKKILAGDDSPANPNDRAEAGGASILQEEKQW